MTRTRCPRSPLYFDATSLRMARFAVGHAGRIAGEIDEGRSAVRGRPAAPRLPRRGGPVDSAACRRRFGLLAGPGRFRPRFGGRWPRRWRCGCRHVGSLPRRACPRCSRHARWSAGKPCTSLSRLYLGVEAGLVGDRREIGKLSRPCRLCGRRGFCCALLLVAAAGAEDEA